MQIFMSVHLKSVTYQMFRLLYAHMTHEFYYLQVLPTMSRDSMSLIANNKDSAHLQTCLTFVQVRYMKVYKNKYNMYKLQCVFLYVLI